MKKWVINTAFRGTDSQGHACLSVGLTTKEWIRMSGDDHRPGDATTFVWIVLDSAMCLIEIGFRPHAEVTEDECLAQITPLLKLVRAHPSLSDPTELLGLELR